MKGLKKLITVLIALSMLLSCINVSAAADDVDAAYKALSYEVITDEVYYAITKDLALDDVAGKIGTSLPISWKSSDESVITDEGEVLRSHYKDREATLTATIGTGTGAREKEFTFTVLSSATNVYSANTFYYPSSEGQLISSVTDAKSKGWGFTKTTTLGSEGMNTIVSKENDETTNYYIKGYRSGLDENVHYTRQTFSQKRMGQLTWEADVKFCNTSLDKNQIYIFEFFGDYKSGQYVDNVQIADFRIHFYTDGTTRTSVTYYEKNPEDPKNPVKNAPVENYNTVITEDKWARVRLDFDTQTQSFDVTIDGVSRLEDVPFYERDRSDVSIKREFLGVRYMQYGPFRKCTYGNGVYLDNVSFRDDNRIYSENFDAYEFSDKIFFENLAEDSEDNVKNPLDLSLSDFSAEMASKNLSVSWTSSDTNALSISGSTATPNRKETPQDVVLTANITKSGKSYTVKKDFNLTIAADEGYERIYNVYNKLTEETFTTEPTDAISESLDFTENHIEAWTGADLTGVDVSVSTSNDAIAADGTVTSCEGDKPCAVTVTLTDTDSKKSVSKTFNYTVLDKDRYVYYSSNFAYPDKEGLELVQNAVPLGYYGSYNDVEGRFKSTIEKENNNYLLKSSRQIADNKDSRFNKVEFSKARGNVIVSSRVKFENADRLARYVFYFDGYSLYEENEAYCEQVAQVEFDYNLEQTKLSYGVKVDSSDKISKSQDETVHRVPPLGEWFDLRVEFDILNQSYDIYISDQKYNESPIPLNYSMIAESKKNNCVAINRMRFNMYRNYNTEAAMYLDDMTITGRKYLQADIEIYENGKRIKGLKYVNGFENNTYSLKTKIVNGTENKKDFDLYVAIYDDEKLLSVKKEAEVSLEPGKFVAKDLGETAIPRDVANVSMKVFFIDTLLAPIEVNADIKSNISSYYTPETYYFEDTGREMTYIDLHGEIAYKPYFNAQSWSKDGTKLYFQSKDHSVYEYDSEMNEIRFIGEGCGSFGLVTTQENKLIYSDNNLQIVEMDCNTREKRLVAPLPDGQTTGANLLTVSNDGEWLSVMWSDTMGTLPTDGKAYRRFSVLNMTTGVWNLDSYYGFDDNPPYNHGMNPQYPNLILFNHCADAGAPHAPDRNWVMDINTRIATQVFKQKPYTSAITGEIYSHETWSYDGELLYIDKSNGSLIGEGGVMSFTKDGKNRRRITSDETNTNHTSGYLHLGVSPATSRFIVTDTGYNTSLTSDIVLVDCDSGKMYNLATTNQRGDDSVAHSHPAFTPDGQKVYFGVFNGDYTSAGIGVIDVSDIVNQPSEKEIVTLSENCQAESYSGMSHELVSDGEGGYTIKNGNFMRVNYTASEKENANAEIEITYFADGGEGVLGYYIWTVDLATHNSLDPHTYTFTKKNTGKWETVTITLDDINLENMDLMGADFYIKGVNSNLRIKSVKLTEK